MVLLSKQSPRRKKETSVSFKPNRAQEERKKKNFEELNRQVQMRERWKKERRKKGQSKKNSLSCGQNHLGLSFLQTCFSLLHSILPDSFTTHLFFAYRFGLSS